MDFVYLISFYLVEHMPFLGLQTLSVQAKDKLNFAIYTKQVVRKRLLKMQFKIQVTKKADTA